MTANGDANTQRWQELMKSMDPVANLNLVADLWKQAADSSDRVVADTIGRPADQPEDDPSPGQRDVRRDIERAIDQMGDATKQLFGQMPWPTSVVSSGPPVAEIAVVDGVGTTEIAVPTSGELWTVGAVSHDGAKIDAVAITFWPSADPNHESPATKSDSQRSSYIIKVAVGPETRSGIYHGQVLVEGAADFLLILQVKVVNLSA